MTKDSPTGTFSENLYSDPNMFMPMISIRQEGFPLYVLNKGSSYSLYERTSIYVLTGTIYGTFDWLTFTLENPKSSDVQIIHEMPYLIITRIHNSRS